MIDVTLWDDYAAEILLVAYGCQDSPGIEASILHKLRISGYATSPPYPFATMSFHPRKVSSWTGHCPIKTEAGMWMYGSYRKEVSKKSHTTIFENCSVVCILLCSLSRGELPDSGSNVWFG